MYNTSKTNRPAVNRPPYPSADRFLPTSVKEMKALGWDHVDIVLFSGDAYVDHPSFGAAVIGRVLQDAGFNVAIVPQPNWQDDLRDFKKFGAPRLFFGVSAGAMDSMVNHYTAARAAVAAMTHIHPADATERALIILQSYTQKYYANSIRTLL